MLTMLKEHMPFLTTPFIQNHLKQGTTVPLGSCCFHPGGNRPHWDNSAILCVNVEFMSENNLENF